MAWEGSNPVFVKEATRVSRLGQLCNANSFRVPIVCNHHHINGAHLVARFVRNGGTVCFRTHHAGTRTGLRNFDRTVLTNSINTTNISFHDFSRTFSTLIAVTQARHLVIIVSRCPCLTRSGPRVDSLLRSGVSRLCGRAELVLVLYNSSLSFVRRRILNCRDPLCNEHATRFGVVPLSFAAALKL